jgi:hypothetical protein
MLPTASCSLRHQLTLVLPPIGWCLLLKEYAQVTKMLGNGRLEAQCFDGEKRLAHIRGKMRKKVRWHSPNSI